MKQDIDKLLSRYYAGETTLDEEKQLRAFFSHPEQVPTYLQQHAPLFQYVTTAQLQQSPIDITARLEQKQEPRQLGKVRQLTSWSLRLAAGVTLLLIGFASGYVYTRWAASLSVNAELASSDQPEAASMKKVLAFDAKSQTSASDRIQAVNQSYALDGADREITQLLINTLNFDANVNVRLAACQALLRFEQEEGVREALIQSLRIQKDPNVQLTLIDALVAIKEKRAATDMQWLARNQQVLEVVRLKAEAGVGALTNPSQSPS
ncbi:HEAT repeat domain-containing protein [Fibrella forsythiae]|uniref:HEAT repeat domain-containing protein n=1 Tax=Fibrella forsythiae TaxID=2817061 RepID=A0ABS3JEU6_9BACT|nr:HEAT repeat domain-containing protein [Fibrella forsythiae]MBO0947953.1 HEAT repeat domain-containing protein [Fibrella forsythiae]